MKLPRTRVRLALSAACLLMMIVGGAGADVSETPYGAWTLRCEAHADGATRSCIMLQNLVLKTGGQPVLQFSIGMLPGAPTATVLISLPLGISLPPGVIIKIDGGKPANFPVERCEPDGCQAGMHLREATVTQLRQGKQLEITFYDGERQAIKMPLSLDGFSRAFDALRAANGAAPAQ